MNKRRILGVALSLCVVAILAVGASLAFFTDTQTATNTFTMGNVKIKLDETDVTNPEGDRVQKNEYNVYPGAVVTKDPIVHNVGENAAYIRATVNVENWMNACAAYYPEFKKSYPQEGYEQSLMLLVDDEELGEGWSIVGVGAGTPFEIGNFSAKFILKYAGTLAVGADTTAMFTKVKVPAGITNGNTLGTITVKAEAMQADGFDTWEAAFAAFDAQK